MSQSEVRDKVAQAILRSRCPTTEVFLDDWDDSTLRYMARREADAAIAAFLEAIKAAGWQMVPKEPTEKQTTAGHACGVGQDLIWSDISHHMALRLKRAYVPACYRAMLAAAPEWKR